MYLTRSKYNALIKFNHLKCKCCDKFSECSRSIVGAREKKFRLYEYIRKSKYKRCPDKLFSFLVKIFKAIFKLFPTDNKISIKLTTLFNDYLKENILNLPDFKPNNYIYLFDDEQAFKLINLSKWNNYSGGHKISHSIQQFRLYPWNSFKPYVFNPSSYCYYGNYHEEPTTKQKLLYIYSINGQN